MLLSSLVLLSLLLFRSCCLYMLLYCSCLWLFLLLCCVAVRCVVLCYVVLYLWSWAALSTHFWSSRVVLGGLCWPFLVVLGVLEGVLGGLEAVLGGLGGSLAGWKLLARLLVRFLDRLGCPRGSQNGAQDDQKSIKK